MVLTADIAANWPIIVSSALVLYVAYTIYGVLTSPLRHVPGPWYAAFTGFPGVIATLQRQQVQYFHALHEKYGPFVRVSPDEVFVADITAYKQIHKIGGNFVKTDFYHFVGPTEAGAPPYGLFQMTNPADHAQRRRLLGRSFTATALREEWETEVCQKAFKAIDGMESDGNVSDVRKWWMLMAADVVSQLMFGKSFGQLQAGKRDSFFDDITTSSLAAAFAHFMPLVYSVTSSLPVLKNCEIFHAWRRLQQRGSRAVDNLRSTNSDANVFASVLKAADQKALTDEDIRVEAAAFMIAGSDTTSNTLTYLIYAILSHDDLQKRIVEEVNALTDLTDDAIDKNCPVLSAAITETLRLYNAAPTPFPRCVPPSGVQLGGYHLPGGTTVTCQSWSIHRDASIFPNPETFDYTRWMPEQVTPEATAAFVPFGAGSRNCIGKHLAMMELRYGAAIFFQRFPNAALAPETTPESMEMLSLVLIEPKSGMCKVILDPSKSVDSKSTQRLS